MEAKSTVGDRGWGGVRRGMATTGSSGWRERGKTQTAVYIRRNVTEPYLLYNTLDIRLPAHASLQSRRTALRSFSFTRQDSRLALTLSFKTIVRFSVPKQGQRKHDTAVVTG